MHDDLPRQDTDIRPSYWCDFDDVFLQLGMKLRVCGAELGGGGPPGEPLEVEGVSHLLLHHNSCSPVPWDERLGLCARLRMMPLRSLFDVHAHGGEVLATVVVVRCR